MRSTLIEVKRFCGEPFHSYTSENYGEVDLSIYASTKRVVSFVQEGRTANMNCIYYTMLEIVYTSPVNYCRKQWKVLQDPVM